MKKSIRILTIILALAFACLAFTACSGINKNNSIKVYYECDEQGNLDKDKALLIDDNEWFYNSNYGKIRYQEEENHFKLYDTDGNLAYEGVTDGKVVYFIGDDKFFYTEKAFDEKELSIITVYAIATNAGYDSTLGELIDAFKGDSVYDIAVKNGYKGTESEWLETLKGATGASPYIGENGNWFVGKTDTGVCASGIKGDTGVGIKDIVLSQSKDNVDIYTILLTNGESYKFSVTNGKDGQNVSSDNNSDNTETNVTVKEMYDFAVENGFDGSYIDFLKILVQTDAKDNIENVNKILLSSVSVVAKNSENITDGGAGSGIIYMLDKNVGTAFIITNYHVVYSDYGEGFSVCDDIKVYLYGSEINNGIDNDMGIPAEFIGGSKNYDIAILKVTNSELLRDSIAVQAQISNSNDIYVGQTVYAAGNAESEGISLTTGIVSVDSENIKIKSVDEKEYVTRRVIRIDAPVNPGNSGGGLFDEDGKVIGIVSAKLASTMTDGIGYAIPSNVAIAVAENVLNQYADDASQPHAVYRPLLGITIYAHSSKAVFNQETGRVYVEETIMVNETTEGALCDGMLLNGDIIKSVKVNDGPVQKIDRIFKIVDTTMAAKVGDRMEMIVERVIGDETLEVTVEVTITEDCMTVTE